jgi:Kdo2-lipid IVA lauroyltransferase/acyltransferase
MKQTILTALMHLSARLPWPALHWLGRRVGGLLYRLDGRDAHNVRVNLQFAYPQLDPAAREQLVRRSLIESAITFVEMPRIWLGRSERDSRVQDNGLPQKMHELLARGHGLILAMPHHGNWEMVSRGVDPQLRITGLYRPPRQAFLEPMMSEGRATSRIRMVPTSRSGIKALHETLKAGDVVAILPDQVPRHAGAVATAAPFFGREAPTMVLLARLAARHDTPVLFVWAERGDDGRYRMQFFEAEPAIRDADLTLAATALNQAVERCIASNPAQYQWAYRRYLAVQEGQPNPYTRP